MILAAEAALAHTGDPRYLDAIELAYGWFLGDNDIGLAMADPTTGACFDGLEPARREPQPGRGVDPHVADGRSSASARSGPRLGIMVRSHVDRPPRDPTHGWHDAGDLHISGQPRGRREPRVKTMDVDAAALFERHAANPILTVGHAAVSRQLRVQPRRRPCGRGHRPAGAGRGPAGDLAPPRRAERGRRDGLAVRRRAAARPATRGSPGGGLGLRGSRG